MPVSFVGLPKNRTTVFQSLRVPPVVVALLVVVHQVVEAGAAEVPVVAGLVVVGSSFRFLKYSGCDTTRNSGKAQNIKPKNVKLKDFYA